MTTYASKNQKPQYNVFPGLMDERVRYRMPNQNCPYCGGGYSAEDKLGMPRYKDNYGMHPSEEMRNRYSGGLLSGSGYAGGLAAAISKASSGKK